LRTLRAGKNLGFPDGEAVLGQCKAIVTILIDYPTVDQIVELNKEALATIKIKKADSHRVLSRARILAAIGETKSDAGDIYDKAASLLIALTRVHAFDSGNRRTALLAALTFLRMNRETARIVHDANVLLGVREGFYSKNEIRDWLKGHAVRKFERK